MPLRGARIASSTPCLRNEYGSRLKLGSQGGSRIWSWWFTFTDTCTCSTKHGIQWQGFRSHWVTPRWSFSRILDAQGASCVLSLTADKFVFVKQFCFNRDVAHGASCAGLMLTTKSKCDTCCTLCTTSTETASQTAKQHLTWTGMHPAQNECFLPMHSECTMRAAFQHMSGCGISRRPVASRGASKVHAS